MPVVQVKMSDECHKALKQYSAFFGVPMGEVLYRFARFAFHKQARSCKWMANTLEQLGIELDKGSEKPCFGFRCNGCTKQVECRTGVYEGLFEVAAEHEHLITEHGRQALASMRHGFYGSSSDVDSSHP